jgi:hypothetical protein
MSARPKSGVREVLESINPFKKKKKEKTVDKEALSVGGVVVSLFRQAAAAGVSLDGQLVDRRDAINALLVDKQYDQARELLESYRDDIETSIALKDDAALYADLPGMTTEEKQHAQLLRLSIAQDIDALKLAEAGDEIDQLSVVVAGAQMRSDLGLDRVARILHDEIDVDVPDGALPKEKAEVEKLKAAAFKAMEGELTAEKIESARALSKPVFDAVDAIERRLEVTAGDPNGLYDRLKLRLNDLKNYPAELRSTALRNAIGKVNTADTEAQRKLADHARAAKGDAQDNAAKAAVSAIGALRKKIDEVMPLVRSHDEQVREFFSTLKRMRSDIDVADTLPEMESGAATPWRAQRQAYDVSRARVVNLQGRCRFREANVELANCARLMKALLDKRRETITADIGTAAGAGEDQARTLVDELKNGNLLKILTPEQQLKLLKALPPGDDNEQARIKIFADSSMDPEFVKAEAVILKEVVANLRGNDGKDATDESREAKRLWQEAEANWATWSKKDPKKILAVFERTVLMQFKELCKLAGFNKPEDYPPGFPEPPVTVVLGDKKPSVFGDTTPVFPAKITINKNHRMFGDFKEMMDTILHENSHAWQNMIVAQFKGEAPFRAQDKARVNGNAAPASMKLQAALFAENDGTYFNSDDSQQAYRHEPLEEQAWGFGGKSAQALLIPPPQRSFDSSKGLKNKFWSVASLSKEAGARIRLKERHGIYVDEWEGESAGDKKLTLEGVPGLSAATPIKVEDVVDEFTLELDLDASALRGRMVSKSELEAEMVDRARKKHRGKKLSELSAEQRKALFDKVLADNDWEASGSEDDQTAVVRATDEVDVEHARLVLDESVAKLT